MPTVTLTTDFGDQDYYVAAIKGAILSRKEEVKLIDISHKINNFDIVQGAFILKNAYPHFPKGTIHLITVNNAPEAGKTFLAVRYDDHYFIGPDNGILALVLGEVSQDIYELEYKDKSSFPLTEIFSKAVAHITSGMPFNEIGIPIEKIEERIVIQPVTNPMNIRGAVVYIDNFENLILNIDEDLFNKVSNNRDFSLYYKRHHPITQLSTHYSDVPIGDILCFFNSTGYLEIAINMGKAASMLGLKVGDVVQIDFNA